MSPPSVDLKRPPPGPAGLERPRACGTPARSRRRGSRGLSGSMHEVRRAGLVARRRGPSPRSCRRPSSGRRRAPRSGPRRGPAPRRRRGPDSCGWTRTRAIWCVSCEARRSSRSCRRRSTCRRRRRARRCRGWAPRPCRRRRRSGPTRATAIAPTEPVLKILVGDVGSQFDAAVGRLPDAAAGRAEVVDAAAAPRTPATAVDAAAAERPDVAELQPLVVFPIPAGAAGAASFLSALARRRGKTTRRAERPEPRTNGERQSSKPSSLEEWPGFYPRAWRSQGRGDPCGRPPDSISRALL